MGRTDCPPLLNPGEHPLCIEQLRILCVEFFPLSTTRRAIMKGFDAIARELIRLQIPADLVVDGSFLTEEIDPGDIDFAVVVTPEFYEACSPQQLKLLEWIRDEFSIKQTHRCDCNLCIEFPEGHPMYFDGIQNRLWWVEFYSKSVVYKRERGVAVIRLEEEPNPYE